MTISKWCTSTVLTLIGALGLVLVCSETPAQNGTPEVTVKKDGTKWVLSSDKCKLTLDEQTLGITIDYAGTSWHMKLPGKEDIEIQIGDKTIRLTLLDARQKKVEEYKTGFERGVKVSLSGFAAEGQPLGVSLSLFICLDISREELLFIVVPKEEGASIKRLNWPPGCVPGQADFTVVPFMQGMLLPRDWSRKISLYDNLSYGRGLYMPWWGQTKGNSGYMVILETPADGGCTFSHRAGGPTDISPLWVHSLGKLSYARKARYIFFDSGNYVTMAKRYRKYVQETGKFVSLKEKIARTPNLANVVGSPVIHTNILTHIQPDSNYYNKKDPAQNHQLVTFDQRAEQLKALKQKGVSKAYVHLDGWGLRGYDNLHPDILPPCPEAGGWDGFKRFADVCDELGYVFIVHDQYRDYYVDAASFDERHTILDEHGKRPYWAIWLGGKQSVLCATLAPGYVRRNYDAIFDHGIKLKGAYLDVFAVVVPDECYNPEHPMSRRDCLKYRAECFSIVRSKGGIVSSEEPVDWALPYIDLVHHGPYARDPNPERGATMGIPVPLFSLVYHDALLLPWSMGKGSWGIPATDLGMLHAILNAGIPYLSIEPGAEEIEKVRAVCDLNQKLALVEMTNHEFLDDARTKQRSTFADGTQVEVDFAVGTHKITGGN